MHDAPLLFQIPSDFTERCGSLRARLDRGEQMTMQHAADALGLPFEFFAAAAGIATALASGRPVLIDPKQFPHHH